MEKAAGQAPARKKGRQGKIIFFLLLFLVLGGATWYFVGRSSGKTGKGTATLAAAKTHDHIKPDNAGVAENKQEPGEPVVAERERDDATQIIPGGESNDNSIKKDIVNPVVSVPDPVTGNNASGNSTQKTKRQLRTTKPFNAAGPDRVAVTNKMVSNDPPVAPGPDQVKPVAVKNDSRNQNVNLVADQKQKDKITVQPVASDKKLKDDTKADDPATAGKPISAEATANKPVPVKVADDKKPADKEVAKKENKDKPASAKATADKPASAKATADKPASAKATADKPASKRKNSFTISLSAGPDVSFTGNDGLGRMKLLGGAGIGYTYKEKFSLRTGFYAARKIYTSSPENYKAPDYFYAWYPNMQKIEADCKVYEIPLNLSYHFSNTARQGFFITAGLSTYLMKRETYDYYYKYTPTGPTIHREYSHYDENKHFFSVLNLGAGYKRNIGKRISITAEPYFKIPLKGVGYGKVKLNSAGVLFSLSIKPFHRVEKK